MLILHDINLRTLLALTLYPDIIISVMHELTIYNLTGLFHELMVNKLVSFAFRYDGVDHC